MSKDRVDALCKALKSSCLWKDMPCKLTAEAIDWLRAKQTDLDETSADAALADAAPFELLFSNCTIATERGPLDLAMQHYTVEDIFKKSRCGPLMQTVHQVARYAAAHATAGVDCATLLEEGLGCTDDNLSLEITSAVDAFFVQFMVCGYNSCILLLFDVFCCFNARLAVFYSTTALKLMFHEY
jgi:hypothetical protein